ncbi:MAG: GGDEF domain-containing protein [Paracoccus sp. (in: a-proteobacteria)]|uniref:GGDEF domain-containing protein n=1 Tax=Paracoccus sp. TaxID=267 RepID=UPI0026E07D45|nr:GGDEF domain-containing protein [Paracoccus sp. (in: a-proteobacteria)]MDO5614280.1 GGDEF domain-containing protein [Paracoccus sp. (in: a-proteobacteria)]
MSGALTPAIAMAPAALDALLPMHLRLDAGGAVLGAGPTLRKLLPQGCQRLSDAFVLTRPVSGEDDLIVLTAAARRGDRVFLRMTQPPGLSLRGHVVPLDDGGLLVNLGFGIGLADAVRDLSLTDGDFAPPELAMELMFLHEANRAVMDELSRFNLRLEEAREAAEIQAFTDPLTGLYNRRGLELALSVALRSAEAARGQGERGGFALAHLDLDRFKEVNDRLGHAAGDEVLIHVADVLRAATRSNDTVARVGGDEFVLILSGTTAPDALNALSRRIISGIEQPVQVDGNTCQVSASIGIAISSRYRHPNPERMLSDADEALYASKNAGRGRATLHDG